MPIATFGRCRGCVRAGLEPLVYPWRGLVRDVLGRAHLASWGAILMKSTVAQSGQTFEWTFEWYSQFLKAKPKSGRKNVRHASFVARWLC